MKAVGIPSEEGPGVGGTRLIQWISIVGLIAVFGIVYVWEQVQTRDLKRDILQLEIRKGKLTEENTRLRVQVAHLSSSDVVRPLAQDLFQLDYPAIGQVINVPEHDTMTGQQVPAVPARAISPLSDRLATPR